MTASRLSRTIYLLADTPIPDDPRVRRLGDLLHAAGWDVTGIGLAGWRSPTPAWRVLAPEQTRQFVRGERDLVGRTAKWARLLAGDDRDVEEHFLLRSMPYLRDIGAIATAQHKPGLWIANDWRLLPMAANAARNVGGRFVYDSHEFATEEYAERLSWRILQKPVAAAVEKRWIGNAAAVVSVSPGITDALRSRYGLTCPLDTVRNAPSYTPSAFRPTGDTIELLYHGLVIPGRGLEACIAAMSLLEPRFRLSIRGPIPFDGYREKLEQISARARAQERVRLLPPVAMTDLVRDAAAFDVGLMALPGHSPHNRFALPNKIFEYMMAGLAICVSDLPAMTDIARSTGAGVTVPQLTPEAIARTLNSLTAEQIDAHKRAALKAAETYNWEREGGRFMALLETLLEPAR